MKPGGIILCGGESKRMGQNKALLKIGEISLIEHVINTLKPLCSEIILSTNSNDLDFLPYRKIADKIPEIGPIAGFYSALLETKSKVNFILSCDSPFINSSFLNYLLSNLKDYDIVLPVYNNKVQSVTGIFSNSIIEKIKSEIDMKNYIPVNIFEKCNTNFLYPTKDNIENIESVFFNINTIKDYEKAVSIRNKLDHI